MASKVVKLRMAVWAELAERHHALIWHKSQGQRDAFDVFGRIVYVEAAQAGSNAVVSVGSWHMAPRHVLTLPLDGVSEAARLVVETMEHFAAAQCVVGAAFGEDQAFKAGGKPFRVEAFSSLDGAAASLIFHDDFDGRGESVLLKAAGARCDGIDEVKMAVSECRDASSDFLDSMLKGGVSAGSWAEFFTPRAASSGDASMTVVKAYCERQSSQFASGLSRYSYLLVDLGGPLDAAHAHPFWQDDDDLFKAMAEVVACGRADAVSIEGNEITIRSGNVTAMLYVNDHPSINVSASSSDGADLASAFGGGADEAGMADSIWGDDDGDISESVKARLAPALESIFSAGNEKTAVITRDGFLKRAGSRVYTAQALSRQAVEALLMRSIMHSSLQNAVAVMQSAAIGALSCLELSVMPPNVHIKYITSDFIETSRHLGPDGLERVSFSCTCKKFVDGKVEEEWQADVINLVAWPAVDGEASDERA